MNNLPKVPDVNSVADGGQLLFAAVGEVVLIGVQAGGLSIAPPAWMRCHYLDAFKLCSMFITQCSQKQQDDMLKTIQSLKGH